MIVATSLSTGEELPPMSIEISASRIVAGAFAIRDYSPLHHDSDYARNVANQQDIFASTQFQSALFERYLQDWAGPQCRLARLKFAMRRSLFAGDRAVLTGLVTEAGASLACGAGARLTLSIHVGDRLATTCDALVGLPREDADNPWHRRGPDWLSPG